MSVRELPPNALASSTIEALARGDLPAARTDLEGMWRAESDQRKALLTTIRQGLQGRFAGVEPWQLSVAVRAATDDQLAALGVLKAAVRAAPTRGLREPATELRVVAIAVRCLDHLVEAAKAGDVVAWGGTLPIAALAGAQGAEAVWWFLTGRGVSRTPIFDAQAEAALLALGPLGLLHPDSLESRRASRASATPATPRASRDSLTSTFVRAVAEDRRSGWVAQTMAARVDTHDELLELVRRMTADLGTAPLLDRWVVIAWSTGLAAARAKAWRGGLREELRRLGRALVEWLPASLERGGVPLKNSDVGFWVLRAATILLRAVADDEAATSSREWTARLLDTLATTGALHPGNLGRVEEIVAVLADTAWPEPTVTEALARPFVRRLAWSSALSADGRLSRDLWKSLARGTSLPDAVVQDLRWWWEPGAGPHAFPGGWEEVDALARDLVGSPAVEAGALRRWWLRPESAGWPAASPESAAPRIASVRHWVEAYRPDRVGDGSDAVIDAALFEGLERRRYVLLRAFVHRGGRLELRGGSLHGKALLDHGGHLDRATRALAVLRREGTRPAEADAALSQLAVVLGEMVGPTLRGALVALAVEGPGRVALSTEHPELFALPWELLTLGVEAGTATLGTTLPLARLLHGAGSARREGAGQRGRMLLVLDVETEGVVREGAAVAAAWRSAAAGNEVTEVRRWSTLREAVRDPRGFEVVHHAGHVGRGADRGPAPLLGNEYQPAREFLAAVAEARPALVFLHGCETAGGTVETDRGHLSPGVLDVVVESGLPLVIGTLWPVAPPDASFVGAFYEALALRVPAREALRRAREVVAGKAAWARCWPAYVVLEG